MKNTKRAAELLAELRTLAENDFERHRIDVLEQDLTAPPKVEVIDDNHQKFNGVTYYCGRDGHYGKCIGIHVAVYRYYCGEIPKGYEIHHKNEDKADNNISNLQILTKSQHITLHNKKGVSIGGVSVFVCENCGVQYTASKSGTNRFCSKKCANIFYYKNSKITKKCEWCGKEFEIFAGNLKQRTCSRECQNNLVYQSHREKRICKICGKEFVVRKSSKQTCCSRKCGHKLSALHRKLQKTAQNSTDRMF